MSAEPITHTRLVMLGLTALAAAVPALADIAAAGRVFNRRPPQPGDDWPVVFPCVIVRAQIPGGVVTANGHRVNATTLYQVVAADVDTSGNDIDSLAAWLHLAINRKAHVQVFDGATRVGQLAGITWRADVDRDVLDRDVEYVMRGGLYVVRSQLASET